MPLPGDRPVGDGRANGDRRVHSRGQVDDGHPHALGAAAWQILTLAGDAHEAAHALGHEVVAGAVLFRAGLPEPGHGAVNDSRIDRLDVLIAEPITREVAYLVVFDQHIDLAGQFAYQRLPFGRR